MLELTGSPFSCCDGLPRRSFLKAGFLGLGGLSLPDILKLRAEAARDGRPVRKTSVIFLELAGGPSQHETWDPKPEAPAEYRGMYGVAKTSVPGVYFSDRLPEQAKVMDKLAIIRSMHHDSGSHRTSAHLTQTGYYLNDRQNNENEMPSAGSITAKVRGPNASGIPAYVAIPNAMRFGGAAYLGKGHFPFQTGGNPNSDNFQVRNLSLVGGLNEKRLEDRQKLLSCFDESRRILDTRGVADAVDDFTAQAFDIVTGNRAREAFDIQQEDPKTRERYSRTRYGQSLLLARRLVEAGVTFVTVRIGGWDYHWDLEERLNRIVAERGFDRGLAALVEDLYERGLDRDVLIVASGEFGRTPRMNDGRGRGTPGRDHWGSAMSVLLAGGGLKVGQVVGRSNSKGEEPAESPYRPENVLATVYRHLGIDPELTFRDHAGRPRYILEEREPIEELV